MQEAVNREPSGRLSSPRKCAQSTSPEGEAIPLNPPGTLVNAGPCSGDVSGPSTPLTSLRDCSKDCEDRGCRLGVHSRTLAHGASMSHIACPSGGPSSGGPRCRAVRAVNQSDLPESRLRWITRVPCPPAPFGLSPTLGGGHPESASPRSRRGHPSGRRRHCLRRRRLCQLPDGHAATRGRSTDPALSAEAQGGHKPIPVREGLHVLPHVM
jgi:hypothetical protein